VESTLVELYADASPPDAGVALAAVGSLARHELGPRSDLDLVLLHDGRSRAAVDKLANRLWYPLWDARVRLDHSVRTPAECADVAGRELSAGVGLLDLRRIAGDADLVTGARSALLDAWRGSARRRLPELLDAQSERWQLVGDAAYLLEPDLKEARGGLRDMSALRALAATWLTDLPHTGVREPYERLLDVRDALHLSAGRTLDRLVLSEVDAVARRLRYDDPDDLRRDVSLAARRIGHAVDLTARAARGAIPVPRGSVNSRGDTPRAPRILRFVKRERRPEYTVADHGLIIHNGEVGLGRQASASDPLIGLRAGALAAQRGLVLSPVTADNLGEQAPPMASPWPAAAREALLELLSSGANLLPVWEALDLAGCIARWIPCWARIRARPQHNPVHRFTVDRHAVQTVVEVQRHLTRVERPDILLLSALFHDIGKIPGAAASHAAVGAPIAREAVLAIGLPAEDADLVERLVRSHLTLALLATKRDHADRRTQSGLVEAVGGRADVLALLRYLTEADGRAAGPAAWTPWRAELINGLADQVEGLLVDGDARIDVTPRVDLGLARSVQLDGKPRIRLEPQPGGVQLVIAARDRLGLFGDTAGLLACHGVSVRSAVLHTVQGVAVNTWRVDKAKPSDVPDPAFLSKELERLEAGDQSMLGAVQRREARARSSALSAPYVKLIPDASESAAVIEVRTADRAGLLYALGSALAAQRFSIRSAHINTLAGQAIDTFYVTESDGSCPDAQRSRTGVDTLTAAVGAKPGQSESGQSDALATNSSTSADVGG
jgi:[protein-PII] uridylyltransferase